MTPKSKAYRKYGQVLGELKRFRIDHASRPEVAKQNMRHFRREARVCCWETELVNTYDALIRDAWIKRGLIKQCN